MQAKNHSEAINALTQWLKKEKLSLYKFTKMINVDYTGVWKWLKGQSHPTLAFAILIEEATNGSIPCRLWKSTPQLAEENLKKSRTKNSTKPKSQDANKDNKSSPKGRK
jgi:transcriptional regulator with XRE-family HTH domain